MTPLAVLAAESRLDGLRAACTDPDATLNDTVDYLRALGLADVHALAPDITDPDTARVIALGDVQQRLLVLSLRLSAAFSSDVRCAPPSGLNEVVREVAVLCGNDSCSVLLYPWDDAYSGRFCSAVCETRDMRERGA